MFTVLISTLLVGLLAAKCHLFSHGVLRAASSVLGQIMVASILVVKSGRQVHGRQWLNQTFARIYEFFHDAVPGGSSYFKPKGACSNMPQQSSMLCHSRGTCWVLWWAVGEEGFTWGLGDVIDSDT